MKVTVVNLLAGKRLFYFIALKRYRKALIEKYRELHIPFRPNRPLLMREVYVPLKVAGSSDDKQIDAYQALADYRRLMVKGPPGSGKSMLLKHIVLSYAEDRLMRLPDWPIPILLELHRLNDPSLTLEQHLVEELARNGFPHAGLFVRRCLEQGALMLLLDGLDEVNASRRGQVVQQVKDLLDKHRNCRFMGTCRTAIYHDEFADVADQTMEVMEFKDQQIRHFLRSWSPSMPPDKSIEQLMQTLSDRLRIMALARNPLLLTIIAYLYTDTNFVLPHSRAEFYQTATDVLLVQWRREQNKFKAREKRLVLQQLALAFQDCAAGGGPDRLTMEYETVLNQVRQVLPDLNLQPTDTAPLLDEIVERSGILLSIDGGMRYAFAHLTLQEFFAAERLRDDPAAMIDRFKSDRDAWRETIKLWCGLVTDSTAAIRVMYAQDPIVAFECLADAQKVDQTLATSIVEEFKNRLGTAGEDTALLHAFGAVASDGRPRGIAVLHFLESALDAANPALRAAAANAISFTNLPRAARALADRYLTQPEFRAPLVRMGDIAVPLLLSQVISNKATDAISDLQTIGTPQAARSLVPLLWREDQQLATQAAWRLAAMLPLPDVEESLRDYPLTQKQKNAEYLDWVWRPFQEPPDSALPVIAGRTARFIDQGATPDAPILLDARLVIPLCATKAGKGFDLKRLGAIKTTDTVSGGEPDPALVDNALTYLNLSRNELTGSGEYIAKKINEAFNKVDVATSGYKTDEFIDLFLGLTAIDKRWHYLMSCLRPASRYDLLRRVIKGPEPTRSDWENIFKPVKYDFRKGWHFRTLLIIFVLVSMASFGGAYFAGPPREKWFEIVLYLGGGGGVLGYCILLLVWAIRKLPSDNLMAWLLIPLIAPFLGVFCMAAICKEIYMGVVRKEPMDLPGDNIIVNAFLIPMLILFSSLGSIFALPLAFLAYFTTVPMITVISWKYVVIFWLVFVGVMAALWLTGSRLHRAAQNPLSKILELDMSSKTVVQPRGILWSLLKVIR